MPLALCAARSSITAQPIGFRPSGVGCAERLRLPELKLKRAFFIAVVQPGSSLAAYLHISHAKDIFYRAPRD
jgi:hypothetical protein